MPDKDNFPQANDVQLALLQILVTSGAMADQNTAISYNLDKKIWGQQYTSISDKQWEIEVKRWETIAWTGIHTLVTDYAIGPKHRDPNEADTYVKPAMTASERQLCSSQKMRKTGGVM